MSKRWERAQERVVGEEGRMERKGQTDRRSGLGRKRRAAEAGMRGTRRRPRSESGLSVAGQGGSREQLGGQLGHSAGDQSMASATVVGPELA